MGVSIPGEPRAPDTKRVESFKGDTISFGKYSPEALQISSEKACRIWRLQSLPTGCRFWICDFPTHSDLFTMDTRGALPPVAGAEVRSPHHQCVRWQLCQCSLGREG